MLDSVYLDYNATAPLRPEAKAAMLAVLGEPANPSSVHRFGQWAKGRVEEARLSVAHLADAHAAGVVFTSGGTEANAQALAAFPERVVITSPTEHIAVLASAPDAVMLAVDRAGVIDLDHLETELKRHEGKALVSLMAANNETGAIQPLAEAARLAHAYGGLIHSDAVQGYGKGYGSMAATGVDMMTVSAHKIGGPAGIGALILREGLKVPSLIKGGGQEQSRRGGTENIAGIAGFGAAASAVAATGGDWLATLARWRDQFEAHLLAEAPDAVVFSADTERLANTSAIAMPERLAETQVMQFDLAGIAISAGAACSSGKVSASHVLAAMDAGQLAARTIRVSAGWATQAGDFERCAGIWLQLYRNRG